MRRYPSKLLLFGEHVLLQGSTALAVPVRAFSGFWDFNARSDSELHARMLQFAASRQLASVACIDRKAFLDDLLNGLVFTSNIPVGYGLGSSGALCAGVYDRYCREKTAEAGELKRLFSQMESFFHGSSSGIDPLTSYLESPLLIQNRMEVSLADAREWGNPPLVFLLDSKLPRQTAPLVDWFLQKSEEPAFRKMLEAEYLPAHEAMIRAWLAADHENFWPALSQISSMQLQYFEPMVPEEMRKIWAKAMEHQSIRLKICGAGGGGFFLGFSRSLDALDDLKSQYELIFPFLASP